jgi:ParB-like chromosome segregation protein Spo0J
MEIVNIDVTKLKERQDNPRFMADAEMGKLKKSLKEFGFVEPLVINQNFEIIGGNQRYKAAVGLGLTEVPCLQLTLDEKKSIALMIALNKIVGRWDDKKLALVFQELSDDFWAGTGFDKYEIENLLASEIALPDLNLPQKIDIYQIVLAFKTPEEYQDCLEVYQGKNVFDKTDSLLSKLKQ